MSKQQLTLGELIQKLETIELTFDHGDGDEPKSVCYDFGTAIPTKLDSWRGDYSHLALGYTLTGYDNHDHFAEINANELLTELRSAVGKYYEGWKGGDFYMTINTPLWVANPGNSGHTAIVDLFDDGWRIVLITKFWEY